MLYEPTKGFVVVIWGSGPFPEDDELEVGLIILFKFCPGITLGVGLLGAGTDDGTGGGIAGGFGKIFGMLTGGITGFCGAGIIILGKGGGGGTLGGGGGVGIWVDKGVFPRYGDFAEATFTDFGGCLGVFGACFLGCFLLAFPPFDLDASELEVSMSTNTTKTKK